MNTIEVLIAECPYPVHVDVGETHSLYRSGCAGYFRRHGNPMVVIMGGCTDAEVYAHTAHEIQHAKCHKINCECQDGNTEYHAFMAGLKDCLECGEALKETVDTIFECSHGLIGYAAHREAAQEVVKTGIWRHAVKLTERKNYAMQ